MNTFPSIRAFNKKAGSVLWRIGSFWGQRASSFTSSHWFGRREVLPVLSSHFGWVGNFNVPRGNALQPYRSGNFDCGLSTLEIRGRRYFQVGKRPTDNTLLTPKPGASQGGGSKGETLQLHRAALKSSSVRELNQQ